MPALDCPDIQIECEREGQSEELESTVMHLRLRDAWCRFSVWHENLREPQGWDSGWMETDLLNFTVSKESYAALRALKLPTLSEDAIRSSVGRTGPFQVEVKEASDGFDISIKPFGFTAFLFDGQPVPDHGGRSEGDWEDELGWKIEFLTERIYLDSIQQAECD